MKLRATLIGFTAILMWSFLALFTAASGKMPPFQLSAICFAIGSIPGILVLAFNPSRIALLKQPAKVWITGVAGLFGYHFLYFTALRNAPAVEAGPSAAPAAEATSPAPEVVAAPAAEPAK